MSEAPKRSAGPFPISVQGGRVVVLRDGTDEVFATSESATWEATSGRYVLRFTPASGADVIELEVEVE